MICDSVTPHILRKDIWFFKLELEMAAAMMYGSSN